MDAVHRTFNTLQNIESHLNKKILFISEKTPDRSRLYNWIPFKALKQISFQLLKVLDMSMAVFFSKKFDAILIFEHKPWYSYLLYFACLIRRKPVFFIVHNIQQAYNKSFFHNMGFKTLVFIEKRFDFWPIHLEISDKGILGVKPFEKSIVIPHPLPAEVSYNNKSTENIKIGILGIFRPDKPIKPILDILSKCELTMGNIYIGTTPEVIPNLLKEYNFSVFDTTTEVQYNNFINSVNIVINNFDARHFYFRPSGVINDSIAGGCLVIVPNYPIFEAQVSIPVQVGLLYSHISEIPNLINTAIEKLKDGEVDFESWREYRSNESIVKSLAEKMSLVMK